MLNCSYMLHAVMTHSRIKFVKAKGLFIKHLCMMPGLVPDDIHIEMKL